MLASMYSAVSGLSVHQKKMDTIGNNVSNVNTYGFKSSRVTFSDVFYQNYSGASAPTTTTGGTNASQLGYGASVGTIDKLLTRGGSASTDRSLDVYINGDGFLAVQDASGNTLYTRLGNLYFDVAGNLVDGNGNKMLGLTWDENGVVQLGEDGTATTSALQAISVDPEILKELTSISIGSGGQITAIQEGDPQVNLASGTSWAAGATIGKESNYSGALKVVSAVPTAAKLISNGTVSNATAVTTALAKKSVNVIGGEHALTSGTKVKEIGSGDWDAVFTKLKALSTKDSGTYEFILEDATGVGTGGGKWTIRDSEGNKLAQDITTAALKTDYKLDFDNPGNLANGDKFTIEQRDAVVLNGAVSIVDGNKLQYTYKDASGSTKTATVVGTKLDDTPSAGTKQLTFQVPVSSTTGNDAKSTLVFEIPDDKYNLTSVDLGTVTPEKIEVTASVYTKSGKTETITQTWTAPASATSKGTTELTFGDITLTVDDSKFGSLNLKGLTNKQIGNVSAGDGTVITIGQLALATFTNQDGLIQEGSGYYTISSNSGPATISVPGTNGTGTTLSASLEMSNVDLASEFTEMIFAQRGFQANSRVVTTSNTLLEELVNLVR